MVFYTKRQFRIEDYMVRQLEAPVTGYALRLSTLPRTIFIAHCKESWL